MEVRPAVSAPSTLTPAAVELAALFDMIPVDDKVRRATAFGAASTAIMQVLQGAPATPLGLPGVCVFVNLSTNTSPQRCKRVYNAPMPQTKRHRVSGSAVTTEAP